MKAKGRRVEARKVERTKNKLTDAEKKALRHQQNLEASAVREEMQRKIAGLR